MRNNVSEACYYLESEPVDKDILPSDQITLKPCYILLQSEDWRGRTTTFECPGFDIGAIDSAGRNRCIGEAADRQNAIVPMPLLNIDLGVSLSYVQLKTIVLGLGFEQETEQKFVHKQSREIRYLAEYDRYMDKRTGWVADLNNHRNGEYNE